ncbi:MAG: metallophosphoesterase family protein [Ruminococcus sp.]|nr:metallophosphoesterase family protein [Candidatus Copronaster equi]
MKKILSIILAITLLLCSFVFNVNAGDLNLPDYTMSDSEWESYWNEVKSDNTQISLSIGKDISELNFNWHSERKVAIPYVKISENEDMSESKTFSGYSLLADNKQQQNRVTVTGLKENTKYYYSYSLGKDNWSEPDFYRTLSASKFKAVLVGDVQCSAQETGFGDKDAANWNKTLNKALKYNPDTSFIISCGDQTQTGADPNEWAATLSPKALRNVPFMTTIGNHDHKGTNYKYYVNNPNSLIASTSKTGTPYFFSYGDVLFVVFNTTNLNVFESYSLAKKAVEAYPNAKWRVAIFHHDLYGTGHHADDSSNKPLRGAFSAILDKFQFDLAFDGHEHYYGRSYYMKDDKVVDMDYSSKNVTDPEGTMYITTASASGKNRIYDEPYTYPWLDYSYMSEELIYCTVEFTENTFSLKTYSADTDKLIDEFKVTKTNFEYDDVDPYSTLLFDTDALSRVLKIETGEYYVIFEVIGKVFNAMMSLVGSLVK